MPIAGDDGSESPFNTGKIKSGLNLVIFKNIGLIIKINKVVIGNTSKGYAGRKY